MTCRDRSKLATVSHVIIIYDGFFLRTGQKFKGATKYLFHTLTIPTLGFQVMLSFLSKTMKY